MKSNAYTTFSTLVLCLILAITNPLKAQKKGLNFNAGDPLLAFGATFIADALQEAGDYHLMLGSLEDDGFAGMAEGSGMKIPENLGREGFTLHYLDHTWWILGGGSAGAMYGAMEFAEQANLYGLEGVRETEREPYMKMRGSKFNIPLDVRTPSYTDVCDAAQYNIEEMWSMEFWKEYLDRMASYRYNFVSLWNMHPFPSMVRVPGYEEIALDNVMRSNGPFNENYRLQGIGFDDPTIMDDIRVVKEMSMDEKISFWKEVMDYGKSRNIDFYVVTWNIFVYGTEGKYGITDDIDNETTVDYFRKSVQQMFLTYPDLAGIGLTTGENMHGAGFREKEEWAFNTYARGTMDAAAHLPRRKITFLHRQHQTGALDIAHRFEPLSERENIDFLFSFKYAKAHVMSAVNQPYCNDFVKEIGE